ncbi:Type I restriction enzyme R protein N terminus (HSDR_N) [Prevotella communis]|uniref:Type I restriction enzyme R protein N terminus (HSDR_N) n=1 Tax=Prevotella communis TaxID=2913614 RepID=A0A1H0KRP4_9BACT|nr:DUF4268 domain-containing protein [Prevotella communis]SDO58627.1 Type I restriction enzyme R protein N terminus (HSDR_N) [Prevotella communis]
MQEKWNYFVYDLCEAKKKDVDEDSYHTLIETQLQHLGWAKFKGEICHKPNIHIGNNNRIEPDILIKRDDEDEFVIEVKRPSHKQSKKDVDQLLSYMRLLKLSVGIYMGEHIEIFYDMPSSKEAISIMKVPLEIDNKLGARFIDKFLKDNFSRDTIVDFCEERIQEIQRQNSLNEIKESLIADAQTQITESLKPYLMEKYGSSFSEEEIKGMLATMHFTASADGRQPEPQMIIPKPQPAPKRNLVKCLLTRNANANGLFNPADQSLTVLKGSTVNPIHVPKISDSDRKKRDRQLAEYTEQKGGKRIVKEDVRFDTPSGAACFCVGGSSNGWNEWKDEEGRKLNEYRVNDGTHKTGGSFDVNRVSDPHQFQLDFWTRFKAKLEATGKIPTLQTPQPHNWYDVRIGRSNILLSNVCNTQKNFVGIKLYIRNQVVDVYYPALEARRNEINQALGCEPIWDANPTARDKTIALTYNIDLTDSIHVEEALDWLVQQTIIFYNVFSKEVKDI